MAGDDSRRDGTPRGITRRSVLRAVAATGAIGSGGYVAMACVEAELREPQALAATSSVLPPRFTLPLRIPPELQPARSDAEVDYYEIAQQEAEVEICPGYSTTIWGYNGSFPGPTIRVRAGRAAVVQHTNQLSTPTVVHLHGGRTPATSDGFPTDTIAPGESGQYVYPNAQRAATLWYHDHTMEATGMNVYMGLVGLYVIEDEVSEGLPLPKGAYDVPLILQARKFDDAGQFVYDHGDSDGPSAAALVNGVPWPRLDVARRRYRLRILNAADTTIYRLALSDGRPLTQIGTDGGLLSAAVEVPEIPLGEAERVEVIIDFADYPIGAEVTLLDQNDHSEENGLLRFRVVRDAPDNSIIPGLLRPVEPIPQQAAQQTRTFNFAGRSINGQLFDPEQPIATPRLGDVEIWTFDGNAKHTAHVHNAMFQVLDRAGSPPEPYEQGWKDTVRLGDQVRVIVRFDGYPGRYVMHCHNMFHEDEGMMARFDVI
jgi:spore coat protein A